MCDIWHIKNKIVAIKTDNASNIKADIKLLSWKQIPRFTHISFRQL